MNTTMADGAAQRLVAQIAADLFRQPGLTLMELAEKVKEARNNDVPLGYVRVEAIKALREDDEVTGVMVHVEERADSVPVYLSALPSPGGHDALAALPLYRLADDANGNRGLHRDDTGSWVKLQDVERALSAQPCPPSSFDLEAMLAACVPGGDIADPQRIADNIRRWFAAQPSPGGQGEALPPLPEMRVIGAGRHPPVKLHRGYTAEQMQDYARAALAARQPVGEPVAWLVHWSDMPLESLEVTRSASRISEVSALTNPPRIVPLYAAPPAQAVGLDAVCQLAEKWMRIGGEDARFCAGELLALIDGKAVGNG